VAQVERQARNQALFREVNERIAELSSGFDVTTEKQLFFCECSHTGCTATVLLSAEEYAQIRYDPATFLVLPGHEEVDREEVLVRLPDYLIVRNEPVVAAEPPSRDTAHA
jgi:hypothetical protein